MNNYISLRNVKAKYFIWILLSISLTACMTEKKAARRVAHLSVEYPNVVANLCSNYIKESHTSTIEYREGKRDTLWQSEYVDCDTVIGSDRIVKVPYPVLVPSRDTLIFRDSVFQENTKRVEALQNELKNTTLKLYNAHNSLKTMRGLNAILIMILATISLFLYLKSRLKWTK